MADKRFMTRWARLEVSASVVLAIMALSLTACSKSDDAVEVGSGATTSLVPAAEATADAGTTSSVPTTSRPAGERATSSPPATRGTAGGGNTGAPPITFDPGEPRTEVPAAPLGGGSGGGAVGAPLKMPALYIHNGRAIASALPAIEQAFVEICKTPTPCVTIVQVQRNVNSRTVCEFDHIEPDAGTVLPRRSTVTVVVGTLPARLGLPCSVDE